MNYLDETIKMYRAFGFFHAARRAQNLVTSKVHDQLRNFQFKFRKPPKLVLKKVQGSWMILDLTDRGIHRDLYLDGYREPLATKHFKKVIGKRNEPAWVEHRGTIYPLVYSVYFARSFSNSK